MEGDDQHFSFMDFPPEIRNMIYEHALVEGLTIQVYLTPSHERLVLWSDLRPLYPPLTRVNQQIRLESSCFPISMPVQITFFPGRMFLDLTVRDRAAKCKILHDSITRHAICGPTNKRDVDDLEDMLNLIMEAEHPWVCQQTCPRYDPDVVKKLSEVMREMGCRQRTLEVVWTHRGVTDRAKSVSLRNDDKDQVKKVMISSGRQEKEGT